MNNRYLVGILTCLAEVAVFGIILADLALNCVQSYFSFPLIESGPYMIGMDHFEIAAVFMNSTQTSQLKIARKALCGKG